MHAVIDRPRATGLDRAAPRPRGQGKGSGYRGLHPALNDRCELALAEHLAVPAASPAWQRAADALALAGRIVTAHGMPARHAAARQQLAGFLGVYDRFFRLPTGWQLTPVTAPDWPLTWRTAASDAVVDVVRTAPPSHPLVDADVHTRLAELATWAADSDVRLVGVRLLTLSAPATSLLHDPVTGTVEALAGTALAGQLPVTGQVSR